jgi:hypothetical protein
MVWAALVSDGHAVMASTDSLCRESAHVGTVLDVIKGRLRVNSTGLTERMGNARAFDLVMPGPETRPDGAPPWHQRGYFFVGSNVVSACS